MTRSKKHKRKTVPTKTAIYYKTFMIHKLSNQIAYTKDQDEIKKARSTIKRLFREIHKLKLKDSTSNADQSKKVLSTK